MAKVRRPLRLLVGVAEQAAPSASAASVAGRAAVLRRLELEVSRRLDGMLSGDFRTTVPGPGTEVTGSRTYGAGDDARRIDWSLTARSLEPHVRVTEADRELETLAVVDRSASLDFGTAEREKREVVLGTLAAFGFLTVRAGNRLGVMVAGGPSLVQLPARAGRAALLAALSAVHDTPRYEAAPGGGADLAAALVRAERTQRRRGQLVVVSDFLDAGWERPLRRLALRHDVLAVHVTDPRELELPGVGVLSVVDPESGRRLHVQTASTELRTRYAHAARVRHDGIRQAIVVAGASHLALSTSRDWVADVARHVGRRRAEQLRSLATPVSGPALAGNRP